ncbi:MAG: phospho-N-acetylmuramoyl-pentapeptide-transferase [Spirochaetales bacterium]|nr:phospho-N-acetylmuramoyl-pentapeptide-transferase [Spirochaetales bacterium]
MFKEIYYGLQEQFSDSALIRLFGYTTFRAALAAFTALFVMFVAGPFFIRLMRRRRLDQSIRNDGPQTHLAKTGTPTMGGILINFAIIISILLWQDFREPMTWVIILCVAGFGLIGFLDDYLKINRKTSEGLQAKFKLIGQFSISITIVLLLYFLNDDKQTLFYFPFFKDALFDLGIFYIPIAVVFLVFTSNAVNLTDGLDGLATGLVIFVGVAFAALTYLSGHIHMANYLQIPFLPFSSELTVTSLALVGACIGFLWFNTHPAQIFMGDTGSLAMGGLIGTLSLMIKKEVLLFIIGGVFMMEAFSVIIQVVSFKLTKKRVFRMAPLHHHFELKGWSETKVVVRFWILGGLFVLLSLLTLKIQ